MLWVPQSKKRILFSGRRPLYTVSLVAFAELTEEEKQIGRRVRAARNRFSLSQGFLAPLMGLSRDQLNSVERGRVALRFDGGLTLCGELDLNPLWLAFGEPPPAGFLFLDTTHVLDDDLFRDAMIGLRPGYLQLRNKSGAGGESITSGQAATSFQLSKWLPAISPKEAAAFWREMNRTAREFIRRNRRNIKGRLTSTPRTATVDAMTPYSVSLWPDLRERIKRVAEKRGLRSELAKACGVSRQVVSAWLSDAGTPNANAALFMRKWIEEKEATPQPKKRAGSASTRPARTRKSKSTTTNEKAKSDQSKS